MNHKGLAGCTVIWFLTFASCNKSSSSEDIIRHKRMASNMGIAQHDTAALLTFWADNITVLTSRNFRIVSKHQYAAALDQEFKTKKDVIYIRTTDKVDIFAEWGMASEHGVWIGRWTEEGKEIEISGSYYAKWQRINGDWLIPAEIYTPLNCSGDSYCKGFALQSTNRDALKED